MRKSFVTLSVLVLALAGLGHAQAQNTASRKAAQPAAPKGQSEGIKVHGHWTIEVRNPDGKLVKDVEFENALNPGTGAIVITSLLTGQVSAGLWGISLEVSGVNEQASVCASPRPVAFGIGNAAPIQPLSIQDVCSLEPTNFAPWGSYGVGCVDGKGCFPVLTMTGPTASVPAITLAGQITAEAPGTIVGVAATLTTNGVPPAFRTDPFIDLSLVSNYMPWGLPVTSTAFGIVGNCGGTGQPACQSPVPVLAGQLVSVSVAISFQ